MGFHYRTVVQKSVFSREQVFCDPIAETKTLSVSPSRSMSSATTFDEIPSDFTDFEFYSLRNQDIGIFVFSSREKLLTPTPQNAYNDTRAAEQSFLNYR